MEAWVSTIAKAAREEDPALRVAVIDTDVHERPGSREELLPYLAEPWRHQLSSPGWNWSPPKWIQSRAPLTVSPIPG